jgi:hypothetical protein
MAPGGFAPPESSSDEPEEGKDHRGDPKDMERETGACEDQDDEKDEKQDHGSTVPRHPMRKRKGDASRQNGFPGSLLSSIVSQHVD